MQITPGKLQTLTAKTKTTIPLSDNHYDVNLQRKGKSFKKFANESSGPSGRSLSRFL